MPALQSAILECSKHAPHEFASDLDLMVVYLEQVGVRMEVFKQNSRLGCVLTWARSLDADGMYGNVGRARSLTGHVRLGSAAETGPRALIHSNSWLMAARNQCLNANNHHK